MMQNIKLQGFVRWLKTLGAPMALLALSACASNNSPLETPLPESFSFSETTIDKIHNAIKNQTANCEEVTTGYIARIKKYDRATGLNAITLINPRAISRARELDHQFRSNKKMQSLHCVPVILKDNFDTADMPTEAGSIALSESIPPDDAFMVRKLREADAIIIAKSNMGEWAFSPNNTISSTHGETKNAYDLGRVPAGSSGGTASAIAANFGVIGIGSDTGNSIRGPASHLALVGIRSTIGATSRDGIVPLLLNRDVGGPLMRTVLDTARVFNVIAGPDAADPSTLAANNHLVEDYTVQLDRDGLKGVRLGVLRQIYDAQTADPEVLAVFAQAMVDLEKSGAVIVDPVEIPDFEQLSQATGFCSRFRFDLNNYLRTLPQGSQANTLAKIVAKKKYRTANQGSMDWAMSVPADTHPADQNPPCVDVAGDPRRRALLAAVTTTMNRLGLDAIIYPSWSNPPRKVADNDSPSGNNSPVIAPHTGQPAITVPMGYAQGELPLGIQFLGKPFSEAELLRYAYAYEQATLHRKPPTRFP